MRCFFRIIQISLWNSQLIAYVVKDETKTADFESDFKLTQAIKQELLETMMSYMMPWFTSFIDQRDGGIGLSLADR